MTPKEKAKDLVDKFNVDLQPFSEYGSWDIDTAKRMALIAVDEILIELNEFDIMDGYAIFRINYFQQVKAEIELL